MKYPKIETLFRRDPTTHKVILGAYRLPEFGLIPYWHVTEKIDGTNIRVQWRPAGSVLFWGRTDNAQIPVPLQSYLSKTFTDLVFEAAFPHFDAASVVTLYGEGYGGKIQKGGNYRKDESFRLFDVLIEAPESPPLWLEPNSVEDIASKLGINTVPELYHRGDTKQAIDLAWAGLRSKTAWHDSANSQYNQEGIVARAPHGLLTRTGRRIMWKLKAKDF